MELTAAGAPIIIALASRDHWENRKLDAKLRRLLEDLKGAITEALSESSDVTRSMDKIKDEGWSVYLVIDQKREDETPEGIELTGDEDDEVPPSFRINSGDLSFLKAIGIDPTRRVRRRR